MKSNIYSVLFLMIVLSCSSKPGTTQDQATTDLIISETIDAKKFQRKMMNAADVIILDVRTPGEQADGFIEGAVNFDFSAGDFQSKIEGLDKAGTYFVYCAAGVRSRKTADLMKELNFREVYDLQGGISQWKAAGLPTKIP